MASSDSVPKGMFNPAVFEHVQAKLDEDAQVREELRNIVQAMERQDRITIFAIVLWGWLRSHTADYDGQKGELFAIEEVGKLLYDVFHMTIEEYLHSLISLIEELARLAVNSVTLGDYHRPLEISRFVKDLHAGFQILNLKNDNLRKRSDSIKYNVKKIEDVVYDLSLRNLVPQGTAVGDPSR
ncbi:MAG: hypothetical protein Q9175_004292 [Cornicularia normoerica]